jgi:fructose-1,6-bisphosphatase I
MKVPPRRLNLQSIPSRYRYWDAPIRRYVDECRWRNRCPETGVQYALDGLMKVKPPHPNAGGVSCISVDSNNRKAGGKLRLDVRGYVPMAMIIERACGAASTGSYLHIEWTVSVCHNFRPAIWKWTTD